MAAHGGIVAEQIVYALPLAELLELVNEVLATDLVADLLRRGEEQILLRSCELPVVNQHPYIGDRLSIGASDGAPSVVLQSNLRTCRQHEHRLLTAGLLTCHPLAHLIAHAAIEYREAACLVIYTRRRGVRENAQACVVDADRTTKTTSEATRDGLGVGHEHTLRHATTVGREIHTRDVWRTIPSPGTTYDAEMREYPPEPLPSAEWFASHGGVLSTCIAPGEHGVNLYSLRLAPGRSLPPFRAGGALAMFLQEGTARVVRERGDVEMSVPGGFYLPAGVHARLSNSEANPAVLLLSVAADPGGHGPVISDEGVSLDAQPASATAHPWAVAADATPWEVVEPSKGLRIRCRYLIRRSSPVPQFVGGTAQIDPRTHYTFHRHEPAEFYHVLAGSATVHLEDGSHVVNKGDSIAVPPGAGHGIDTGEEPVELYWLYFTAEHEDWTWEPLEPIYPDPPFRIAPDGGGR